MQALMGMASAQLGAADNEIIVQMMLGAFTASMRMINEDLTNEDIMTTLNMAMILMGFRCHLEDIPRDKLDDVIYYARVTEDFSMLRSQYHPIKLMDYMTEEEIPESYSKLFHQRAYLPNIISVWDRGDRYTLISFQEVRVHYGANAPQA